MESRNVFFKSRSSGFVTPCSVVRYQRFGGRCYLHLQGEVAGIRVRVTLQLTVGRSVLALNPSGTHDKILVVVKTAWLPMQWVLGFFPWG
jgi:hypothetical protein